jgi:recombination protein RecR
LKSPVESLERVIRELSALPGIGRRSAERMAYYLLAAEEEDAMGLALAIRDLKKETRPCKICGAITCEELCAFCSDPSRQVSRICVVESMRDLVAIEDSGAFRGLYHILGGRLSPTSGHGPGELNIDKLVQRATAQAVEEVILATNPDMEGDGTAAYLAEILSRKAGVVVSRLACGLSAGGQIELAGRDSLGAALAGRRQVILQSKGRGSGAPSKPAKAAKSSKTSKSTKQTKPGRSG